MSDNPAIHRQPSGDVDIALPSDPPSQADLGEPSAAPSEQSTADE